MSSKRKEEEERVLREVFGDDYDSDNAVAEEVPSSPADDTDGKEPADAPAESSKKNGLFLNDKIHCPRCSHLLKDRHGCPYCGYNGYIPMSAKQTLRIRLILFPVIALIAVVLYLILSK